MMRALMLALALPGTAFAQAPMLVEGVRFTLKPRPGLLILRPATEPRARMGRLGSLSADDRPHVVDILFRRQKQRLMPESGPFDPRSRLIRLTVEDSMPLGDHITAMAGFQGVKVSNRSANVTATGSDDGLRVRDWFQPRAEVEFRKPDCTLTVGYGETVRGYGETGRSGPLGLTRPAFRSLAQRLRPERRKRMRIDADWSPSPDLTLGFAAYGGRIDDRLSFIDRGYLPRNGGSAGIQGARIGFSHRLSPHGHWAMRYGEARLNHATERSLAVEAGWISDRWSGMLRATRSSAPLLLADAPTRPLRVEAEMRYRMALPAYVTLRLTDPDRLASSALLRSDPTGAVYAADQARGVMLGMGMRW